MTKEKTIKTDIPIEKKISSAERKVKAFFKNLPTEKLKFIEPLIHQLAFIQVTLDRIVEEINNSDILEDFEQGSQKFKRENPALKSYNATVKSYTLLSKQLVDMLPDTEAKRAGEALMGFVTQPPKLRK